MKSPTAPASTLPLQEAIFDSFFRSLTFITADAIMKVSLLMTAFAVLLCFGPHQSGAFLLPFPKTWETFLNLRIANGDITELVPRYATENNGAVEVFSADITVIRQSSKLSFLVANNRRIRCKCKCFDVSAYDLLQIL